MKYFFAVLFLLAGTAKAEITTTERICYDDFNHECSLVQSSNSKTQAITDDANVYKTIKNRNQNNDILLVSNQEMTSLSQGPLPTKVVTSPEFEQLVAAHRSFRNNATLCGTATVTCLGLIAGSGSEGLRKNFMQGVKYAIAASVACLATVATCDEALARYDDYKKAEEAYQKVSKPGASIGSSAPQGGPDINGDGKNLHPRLGIDPNHPDFGTGGSSGRVIGTDDPFGNPQPIEWTPRPDTGTDPDKIEQPE